MQKFSLILTSEEEAESTIELLWNKMGIRGEIESIPMDGHIKLDIITEQDLSNAQLEKLPGKRT